MKSAFALVDQFEQREKELTEGLIASPPPDYAAFRYALGQIHEVRETRKALKEFFRMKDEEEL